MMRTAPETGVFAESLAAYAATHAVRTFGHRLPARTTHLRPPRRERAAMATTAKLWSRLAAAQATKTSPRVINSGQGAYLTIDGRYVADESLPMEQVARQGSCLAVCPRLRGGVQEGGGDANGSFCILVNLVNLVNLDFL